MTILFSEMINAATVGTYVVKRDPGNDYGVVLDTCYSEPRFVATWGEGGQQYATAFTNHYSTAERAVRGLCVPFVLLDGGCIRREMHNDVHAAINAALSLLGRSGDSGSTYTVTSDEGEGLATVVSIKGRGAVVVLSGGNTTKWRNLTCVYGADGAVCAVVGLCCGRIVQV